MKKAVSFLLAAALMLCVSACGNNNTGAGTGNNTGTGDGNNTAVKTEKGVKITKTAANSVETEVYQTSDFSITIPKGWTVESGGVNIYHSIHVFDPAKPVNGMFVLLKAECLLHSEEGKQAWQFYYNSGQTAAQLLASAPVLSNPSTENFYKIFSQYTAAIAIDPTYNGYTFPKFDNFTVTDRFEANDSMKAYALGDEVLRATFESNGQMGEGMFTAAVVDFGSMPISNGEFSGYLLKQVDGGYYMAYNIAAVTAEKDTFIEWENILTKCLSSLEYSDSFVSATVNASNEKLAQAKEISRNFNQTMDGIMSSWENRSKSQDIMSQKQSDATLGYERVYDTETGEVYKATNGFTDVYDGKRYQPVTDDSMYALPTSGYIERD